MNRIKLSCYFHIIFFSIVCIGTANSQANIYWQCETLDKEQNSWMAINFYQKVAINLAYSDCKKNSKYPLSCKAAKSGCDQYLNGMIVSPLWRCTTYDRFAQPWKSNYYKERDDAALAAQAFCKSKSAVPDTCYTNTVTCENINTGVGANGIFSGANW